MSDSPAAADSLPTVTLLYGDDHQALHDRMVALVSLMSDSAMPDMNINRFDGSESNVNLENIRTAAYTLPFLAARRMVIVTNPVNLMKSDSTREKFVQLLASLPESTAMVLLQDDTFQTSGEQRGWKQIYEYKDKKKNLKIHPVLEWARSASGKTQVEVCRLPALNAMPGWIAGEAKRQGGRIHPQAAIALAAVIGSDTGQARQELTKLLAYVDFKRPIELVDVQELTPSGGQADVFVMADALAMGDSQQALRHLGLLLVDQDAISLYGMIVRQYRLIMMAKEAYESGITTDDGIGKVLGIHPFPAGKAMNQARRYNWDRLTSIYHRLLEIDRMSKTGQSDLEVALQSFIAEMGR